MNIHFIGLWFCGRRIEEVGGSRNVENDEKSWST